MQNLEMTPHNFATTQWRDELTVAQLLAAVVPGEPQLAQFLEHALGNQPGAVDALQAILNIGNGDGEDYESAADASMRHLHQLPALRGLRLDACTLTSLRWLHVRGVHSLGTACVGARVLWGMNV